MKIIKMMTCVIFFVYAKEVPKIKEQRDNQQLQTACCHEIKGARFDDCTKDVLRELQQDYVDSDDESSNSET